MSLNKLRIDVCTILKSHDKDVNPLTDQEICFLLRRRLSKTQRQCAAEMGISRYWFNMMEKDQAPSKALVEYWSRNEG